MVLSNHTDAVLSSTIANNRLITGSRDGSIAISDLESGHHLHALKGHQEPVYELAMTKDGKGIISRSTDGKFNLWDLNGMNLRTGQHQLKRTLSIGSLAIPVYSPDRSLYVQTTEPHIGALLLAATKKPYVYFKGHAARITCAAFSPDGSRVVTGSSDETAKLWDIQTGLELLSLGPHGAAVTHAQFSADGQAVVTGTSDGRVFVWKSDAWK
jgi:WD40 repeat protein